MSFFSEAQLSEVRERVKLSDLVSDYVQLRPSGKNFLGLCPFHSEKSPSFFVSPERETFHCFGCGVGGNAFHFLMKIESIGFPEAVSRLAERCGMELTATSGGSDSSQPERARQLELLRQAAWYYHCLLKSQPEGEAASYLHSRDITASQAEQFYLGYCPPSDSGLKSHLQKKGFSLAELGASQLFRGEREFFRGRLIFPIFRGDRKVVGFGGRRLREADLGPKYLNSSESPLFRKSELFYGMPLARGAIQSQKRILIVEGYFDVLRLHAHGFPEAVAPLGTSLTSKHILHLKRLKVVPILIFDADAAGMAAAERALALCLSAGISPEWVELTPGEDPDSFLRSRGRLVFAQNLHNRRNLLQSLLDKWTQGLGQSPEEKSACARRAMELIRRIPDSVMRGLYVRELASQLKVPETWLEETKRAEVPASLSPKGSTPRDERKIIEFWLKYPQLRSMILEELKDFSFSQDWQSYFQDLARHPKAGTSVLVELAPEPLRSTITGWLLSPEPPGEIDPIAEWRAWWLQWREQKLKAELKELARSGQVGGLPAKIEALSEILKNKARSDDAR